MAWEAPATVQSPAAHALADPFHARVHQHAARSQSVYYRSHQAQDRQLTP